MMWHGARLIAAAFLTHLLLTCALAEHVHVRQLAQDDEGPLPVSSAEELLLAILNGTDSIHFTSNLTLPGSMFPEPPATCLLENDPGIEAFRQCAPDAVVYTSENPDQKAVWTADPGVVLDASYLFRGIMLNRPLDLRAMTFAQIVDDLNPYFFLFGVLRGVSVAYRSCTLLSQCGGKGPVEGPRWMDQTLVREFPLATRVAPTEQDEAGSFLYNALSKIPIRGAPSSANIQLLSGTKITCYLPGEFPRLVAPSIWEPGSASIAIRNEDQDDCQRPETYGADYRGRISQTVTGLPCANWDDPSPNVRHFTLQKTATADNLPEFGLGDHSFCRNPDRHEGGVWCYAVGQAAARQQCDVRSCTVPDEFMIKSNTPSEPGLSSAALLAVTIPGGVLLLAAVCGICYCCRGRLPCRDDAGKSEGERVRMELEHPRTDVTVDIGSSSAMDDRNSISIRMANSKISAMHGEQPSAADRLEEELRKTMSDAGGESQLQFKELVGEGAHGRVYHGVWKTLRVAIKNIPFYGPAGTEALEDYATSALSCSHANIVKTLQCFRSSLGEGPEGGEGLDLLHEHCDGGDLATAHQSGFFVTPEGRVHHRNMMQVAWEMSAGLNYLHSKGAVHGDLNPRNVLFKGHKVTDAGAAQVPCLAEVRGEAAVRARYSRLSEGFIVKISDFGLALIVRQTGTEAASLPPVAQFYMAPEALEFGEYTEAADVFSFGVLLWEMYHSQTAYKKTQSGFYIRTHVFPKFDAAAWLPYAALTVACLHSEPSNRPSMDKAVAILQDMLMGSGTQVPAAALGVGEDGATNVTALVRSTLGEAVESYRRAPGWRGVLQELNNVTSSNILDLLLVNPLVDIFSIAEPHKQPHKSQDTGNGDPAAATAVAAHTGRPLQPAAATTGGAVGGAMDKQMQMQSTHNSIGRRGAEAVAAERAPDGTRLPGGDVGRAGDRGGGAGVGGVSKGLPPLAGDSAAKITMLLHSIDRIDRTPELGHARMHSVTSEEESEMFEDAKDELMSDESFFISQGQAAAGASGHLRRVRPPWVRSGAGSSMRQAAGRLSADRLASSSVDAAAATAAAATSPRLMSNPVSNTSMDGLAGRMHGMGSGAVTPVTGDLVSSRSNVSMVSDWDQVEMVKDEATGKTRFNVQILNFGGRGGGMKGLQHSSHSLTRTGDGLSHGHNLSSAALTSATSGIESNPGTPLASQTLDAAMAGEQAAPMPVGSASGTPVCSSILSTGGAAVAVAAAAGNSPSVTHSPPTVDGGAAGGYSEALLRATAAGHGSTDGQRSTLEEGFGAADIDEEAAMEVLQWGPAVRAQNQAAARRGTAGLDSNASPSQLTTSHITSAGSNSSLSSLSGVGAAVQPRAGAAAAQAAATGSHRAASPDAAPDSKARPPASSPGVRHATANTTMDRLPSAALPSAAEDARAAHTGAAAMHGAHDSADRAAPRLASGPDTGGSGSMHPVQAGRAAAATHLGSRPGFASSDSASVIAIPNVTVKGRAARSFDGVKLGEFRPMGMRSDRIRSYDAAQQGGRGSGQLRGGSARLSPGTSLRGNSEEGTSRGMMGLQSLFDSAEDSDGTEGGELMGLAEALQQGVHGPMAAEAGPPSLGDSAAAKDSSFKDGKSRKDKSQRAGSSATAADKAARKAARRALKQQARAGFDLAKLKKEIAQASGSEGSPLSMKDLDISHTSQGASDSASITPAIVSGDQAATPAIPVAPAAAPPPPAAAAAGAVDAASPAVSGASGGRVTPPLASGSATSVASSTNEGAAIDLNPQQARGGAMGGRSVSGSAAGWRMSTEVIARHGTGRRSTTDALGKSTNVRMYMHPLLRNNRAAIAHVEKIQLKGTDDTSASGTGGSSLEHGTTSSGPHSSTARSSQARSHTSATGSGAVDRATM